MDCISETLGMGCVAVAEAYSDGEYYLSGNSISSQGLS